MAQSFRILPAGSPGDVAATVALMRAYAASLPVDLGYQGFEAEMAAMPGAYAPPRGALLLARAADGTPLGCVAMRPLSEAGCCEMKRLYVDPAGRGLGLGSALVEAVLAAAAAVPYREMWLDTLPTMTDAMALYRRLGFEPMPAYYPSPVAGTVYLRRRIGA